MRRAVVTTAAAVALACTTGSHGPVAAANSQPPEVDLPAAGLLGYGPADPRYIAIADVSALAATATGHEPLPVAAIAGIPALMRPGQPLPWLDPDQITEFAHFGPTGFVTEDGPEMITVIATDQGPDDLTAGLVAAGWNESGEHRFAQEMPAGLVGASWVHVDGGIVIMAQHERHLDVALDPDVETSTELPIVQALTRARGHRRTAAAGPDDRECGGVIAAGDDAAGGGTLVIGVGDDAVESRVEVDATDYVDPRGSIVHAVDHVLDGNFLVITTAVDDPESRTHLSSTTGLPSSDMAFDIVDRLYRC